MAGQTIREFPHPTRLTGDAVTDLAALHEYVWALFRVVFLERGGLVQGDDIGGLAGTDIIATDDIQNFAVTLGKMQQIASDRILGRASAGPGIIELLTCTATGRALIACANEAAMRTLLDVLSAAESKAIAQNPQSANYTLVLADANKHILHPSSDNNARTFTIPANSSVAYAIGTPITFVNEINTVTIAINSDTLTLAGAGSTGSRTLAANGMATALKTGSTKWVINGTGLS